MRFRSREHAAQLLAERLSTDYKNRNPLVLGIPRAALPMAEIIEAMSWSDFVKTPRVGEREVVDV